MVTNQKCTGPNELCTFSPCALSGQWASILMRCKYIEKVWSLGKLSTILVVHINGCHINGARLYVFLGWMSLTCVWTVSRFILRVYLQNPYRNARMWQQLVLGACRRLSWGAKTGSKNCSAENTIANHTGGIFLFFTRLEKANRGEGHLNFRQVYASLNHSALLPFIDTISVLGHLWL